MQALCCAGDAAVEGAPARRGAEADVAVDALQDSALLALRIFKQHLVEHAMSSFLLQRGTCVTSEMACRVPPLRACFASKRRVSAFMVLQNLSAPLLPELFFADTAYMVADLDVLVAKSFFTFYTSELCVCCLRPH